MTHPLKCELGDRPGTEAKELYIQFLLVYVHVCTWVYCSGHPKELSELRLFLKWTS